MPPSEEFQNKREIALPCNKDILTEEVIDLLSNTPEEIDIEEEYE